MLAQTRGEAAVRNSGTCGGQGAGLVEALLKLAAQMVACIRARADGAIAGGLIDMPEAAAPAG